MRLTIALIRGGATASGEQGKIIGITDEPVTPRGAREVACKAESGAYPEVSMVYTSGLTRCRECAHIIYPAQPAIMMQELEALDYGSYEGMTLREITRDKQFPAWAQSEAVEACPEGEPHNSFAARCHMAYRNIVEELSSKGIEAAAVVTHRLVIDTILRRHLIPKGGNGFRHECGGGVLAAVDTRSLLLWVDKIL